MAFTFGSPFLINTQPVFDQDNVSLAGLANGLFVAVYEAKIPGTFGNKDAIGLQIFNGDGSKRGGETNVTAAFPGTFFDTVVVAAPDGTFYYFVGVAPQADYAVYGNAFEDIINSVRFR